MEGHTSIFSQRRSVPLVTLTERAASSSEKPRRIRREYSRSPPCGSELMPLCSAACAICD